MELRIEGNQEEQFAVMKSAVIQMHGVLKGNGQDGLETKFEKLCTKLDTYVSVQQAIRDERAKQDDKHTLRLNVLIGVFSLIAAVVIATCAVITLHANQTRSILDNLNLSTSQYQYTLAERTTK